MVDLFFTSFANLAGSLNRTKLLFVNDHDVVFVSREVELGVVLNLFGKSARYTIIIKLFEIAFNQSFIGDQEVDSLNASRSQKQ
jgi:hypothetical protein